jgi:hypothetical protein
MGKQKFIIPTDSQIDSISKSGFIIPKNEDIQSIISQKKNPNQNDMVSSGAKPSMDGSQEEDGWFSNLKNIGSSTIGSLKDFVVSAAKGAYNNSADAGIQMGRNLIVGLLPDMFWSKEKMTWEQKADAYNKNIASNVEKVKGQFREGASAEIYNEKEGFRIPDADALGEVVGRQLMQLGLGTSVGGLILNHLSNTEANYREAKEKGLSEKEAFVMSNTLGLTETLMDKFLGVDKLVGKAVSKNVVGEVGKKGIAQLADEVLSFGAFKTGIETGEGAFKRLLKQGVLPEMGDEFLQTYVGEGEKMLFDQYKKAVSSDDPNTKLSLYDADAFTTKTFISAANSSFIGGLIGGMGAGIVGTDSYTPTVYSALLNSYDSQGKQGLESGVEDIKKGLTKAFEKGTLDADAYNNSLKNVDKIAQNVGKFEQKSQADPYSRYVLYDQTERIIPQTANRIARTLAEATTPLELPTQDQIDDNIKNGQVSAISFQQENQIPAPYKPYAKAVTDEQGNNVIQAEVPNSVVEAYNANQMAVQEAMNNPLFAIDSLTNNNNIVTIDDIKRIGQQGGLLGGDLSQQLNFNIAFEANKNNIAKGLRVINYAKGISNSIANGANVNPQQLQNAYAGIYSFNEGDTVFYNNKSAKVMEISPDGQKLKLSGVQEQIGINDNDLRLQDAATEQAMQTEAEQQQPKVQPTESKLGTQFEEWNAFASQNPTAFPTEARLYFGDKKQELTEGQTNEVEDLIARQLEQGAKASDILANLKDLGYSTQESTDAKISFSNYINAREAGRTATTYTGIHKPSTAQQKQAPAQRVPLPEEEQITGRTMRDAVGELIPFTLDGETGEIYTTNSGVVTFESPNKIVEFGNIKDIGDMSIDEFGIVPQEMSIGENYSVTIDGKTFTNKNQNPFRAITYDADGNAVSIKLENEKGQTRVIKGTRAVVIDAKYKVKQLFDESTRDQLAAATDDAANQAAAIEDTRGQSTEAPTPTASKPVEQAPTIAQRESAERVRAIAERLAAEETEQMTQNRQSVANLASSLFSSGIQVEVLNAEQIRIKYGKNTEQGMFISSKGTIVINESVLPSEWGKTIIFHEGTHPIINIIRNTEPKLYKQLVDAIKEEAKINPEVNTILQQINASKQYGDEFTRNDELVVEAIARVASGKLKLNDVKPSLRQAMINLINKIGKMMGFKRVLKDSNQVALTKLANQISEVLNAGRDISEIVGSKNVTSYESDISTIQNRYLDESKLQPVSVSEQGHELSFVKQEDLIDIVSLINEISEKKQKVWFWVADQLGRGYYFDEQVGENHFLDAGISFALDPENKKNNVIWASGVKDKKIQQYINSSDYIFIVSGSPERSKLFNKRVFDLLINRNKDFAKFKNEILAVSKIKDINDILNSFKSWEQLRDSPLRKDLLVAFKAQEAKNTELKKVLEQKGAILNLQSIRDGFLRDNNFNLNDIMLVLKPTGIGGKSDHSTYETNILGEVIGVPNKKINAFEILPDEVRGENPEQLGESQRSQKIAPYGVGIKSVEGIQMSAIDRTIRVAPNGQPSNLNEYQYNAVRTPEFKAWFGDWENDPENASKIVDENGEPMVVYTGTSKDKDFQSFNVPANGAWFTSDPSVASSYAEGNDSQKTVVSFEEGKTVFTDVNTSPRVIPVFLNIKNLIDFRTTDLITDSQREKLRNAENYKPIQKKLFTDIFFSKSYEERMAGDFNDGIEYSKGIYVVIKEPTQIKSAIGSKFSPTNPKIQMSEIDRAYTPESTVAEAGMTMAEREAWRNKNKVSQKQKRVPVVMQASRDLFNGDINFDNYVNIVRDNMAIMPFNNVPKLPSLKEIISSLNEDKLTSGGIVGVNKTFADGERVASRLDIPAYENYDTWVVSIHDSFKEGKILGYGQTAVLRNVEFKTSPKVGLQIAADATFLNEMDRKSKGKETIARIHGDWVNESPEAAHKRATELMNDPQWVQVGMNPFRHSFFYDKSTGEALLSAEEVIQVGALVLAKNPVRAPFGSQAFVDNFSYVNKLGEQIQFSDLSRDDKRIQTIRREFSTYPKGEIVQALMGAPFNLSQEKAEDLVARAFADPLAPSLPTGNPDTAIPEGSKVNEKSNTVDEYNAGYNKYKKALLDNTVGRWKSLMKGIALEYDSRFYARRKLGLASSEASLAQAQLRNLNGIAYSASQDLAKLYEDIFGNGLEENGIETLGAMIFNLRVMQIDKNTENKFQDEVERLTVEFMDANNRTPTSIESRSIAVEARKNVPIKSHGKTRDGVPATSQTSKAFLDALRLELGENEYNMLKGRADMFRKAGNDLVEKLRKAGIISDDVAKAYKDDFYAFRMTLDKLYGKEDASIVMMNGVPSIKGWTALSKEGTENYINQDARLMLAQSYIGTARAIAKNAFRESVFNENIKTDQNGNEQSVIALNGEPITFVKPANYIKDADGNVRSNGKELSVRDADEGYVNVPFKKDGVVNYYQMEKEIFDQLEGNNIKWKDAELSGGISNAYYATTDFANRMLTGFATRNNPFFWIGNVPMDLQQQIFFTDIWTQGSLAQSNVYVAGARAVIRTIKFSNFFGRNTEFVDKTLEEYVAAGGAMDRMSTMKEQRQRSINVAIVETQDASKLSKMMKKAKSGLKTGTTFMNERTEIAMRLAAYDQSKKNLIKKFGEDNNGAKPNESQMLKIQEIAASQSRAYTDFSQRGISLPNLNIAYLNSSIQAAGAAAEYIYDNPAKASAKVGQLVVGKFLGTVAIMAIMGDAYDELDEYRKDLYSFAFSKDTGLKDKDGNPIYVTADVRNNPTLVPVLGVTRRLAERTMRALQGKEQEEITALGTLDEFTNLLNQAMPIAIPNVTSVDALKKSSLQLITKHTLANAAVKGLMGFDAFRNKDIISQKDKNLSPYMQGMDDPNVPYFYKAIAKSMSGMSSSNQISPASMQAVAETFLTSPRTNPIVGLMYMTLSDVANTIIPAKTDSERGAYTWGEPSKIMKSVTGRFATFTDAQKADFRKNEQLYIMSKEESMKFNDTERVIDNQLKEIQKNNSGNFFDNVDKLIKDEGYDESIALVGRIKAKAASVYRKDIRSSLVNEELMNEVRILHYTQGAEGKAKLIEHMFGSDKEKAQEVFKSLVMYGSPAREVFEAKEIYNKGLEK